MTSSVCKNAEVIQNKLQCKWDGWWRHVVDDVTTWCVDYISVCEEAGIDHELNLENRFSLLDAIIDMYAILRKWADIELLLL